MNTTRRSFIKKTSFATVSLGLFSHPLFAAFKKNQLTGVQLYSVRDQMKENPSGTLKQISDMGYKYVEHANYVKRQFYGYDVNEFKKLLDDLGLKMVSGHTVMRKEHWDEATKDFTSEWKYTVEDAATLGQQYVISPSLGEGVRKNQEDLMGFLELFNKSGELCKKSGMKFGYHNHDFEFTETINGKSLYDLILQNTDPDLVIQQLDIGNMYTVGGNPIAVIQQYPGRFKSLHVKDEIKNGENKYESTILGKGVMDIKKIIDLARDKGGTEHFIIEQESYQGQKPLDTIKADLEAMKKWGY